MHGIPEAYQSDVLDIVKRCLIHDLSVSPMQAYQAWDAYSDMYAAGWLVFPDTDEELVEIIRRFL